jgi:antitoxin HigA-1
VNGMRPIHPGEVLREEYLKPLRMSVGKLARALRITRTMAREILCERRPITPKISVRLERYFGGDARLWMNMQQSYEVKIAQGEAGVCVMNEAAPRNARL